MKRFLLTFCLLFTLSLSSYGQFWDKFKFWEEDSIPKKEGIFLFPLLYYTPDTRFAAGAVGVYYFNTGNQEMQEGRDTRLSFVKLLADYTQNKQFDVWSSWNIFTDEEKYLFKGEIRYRNFPDRFYGVGNNTRLEQEEFYSYDLFNLKVMAMKKLRDNLFLGIDYQLTSEYNFTYESENTTLASGNITGYRGGIGSAIGGVLTFDSRDNVVNAYSGSLFETSVYSYNNAFGGSFNFTNVNLTYNKYWEFKKDHVLALGSSLEMNFGEVPFLDMAKVGGSDMLRGYAENRFRDRHFAGIQLEYRFPIWKRFGIVVFTGIGDVFDTPNDLRLNNLKYSLGAGIRFAINKKERLNVCVDFGLGRKSNAFYIGLTEAF